jgi:uncharacterized membrane protein YeiB
MFELLVRFIFKNSGISLITFTMGYGLVAVPRTLWRKRNQETNLKLL